MLIHRISGLLGQITPTSKVDDLVPSHSQKKTMSSHFSTPVPPTSEELQVSFPEGHEHVLLLTLNRPKSLNAMTPTMQADLQRVLQWYDDEPSLWYVRLLIPLFSILFYSFFAHSPRLLLFFLRRCSASVFFSLSLSLSLSALPRSRASSLVIVIGETISPRNQQKQKSTRHGTNRHGSCGP